MEREGSKAAGRAAKLTGIHLDSKAIERKKAIFAAIEKRRKEHNAGDMRKKNLPYETVVTDPPYLTEESTILFKARQPEIFTKKI